MKSRCLNRELSWLEFNQRVLCLARDPEVPLLERVKFLAITGSNLDEFFMVRVGGLHILVDEGKTGRDSSGMTPVEALAAINKRAHRMMQDQSACFREELEPALAKAGIRRLHPPELNERQTHHVERLFEQELYPVLSPIAARPNATFPLLNSHSLHVGVQLKPAKPGDPPRFAVIPLGRNTNRFVSLPVEGEYAYILVEDVIRMFIGRFFEGEAIEEAFVFRLARNADMAVREEFAADLMSEMQAVIDARKRSDCVHLTVEDRISEAGLTWLRGVLQVDEPDIYRLPEPLDFSGFHAVARVPGYKDLKDKPWPPQPLLGIQPGMTMFDVLARQDLLLLHPYDSFDPVIRLISEAADDPAVLAIKQTLYRTSRNSPIINALARAAERGKYVTAVVELKARFDEERNIERATILEDAGVQVIYGVKGLKTHAKACLIVRKEADGIHRYLHFGTGNYNEVTAQVYSDASYMTRDEYLGADASAFFNAITGYSQPGKFHKLHAAPLTLRQRLLELIQGESERRKQGQKAAIWAKLNALVDPEIIDALYAASQAGVTIRLGVRGTCCLRPGVAGLSENISVVSVVDRYLEHARVMYFQHGGEEKVLISSADWMPRNLDRRIELLVPVEDADSKARLLEMMDTSLKDTACAWRLLPDGAYERIVPDGKRKPLRSQEALYRLACERSRQVRQPPVTTFEPHRPPAAGS